MYSLKQFTVLVFSSFVLLIHCAISEEFSSAILDADEEKRAPGWGKRNSISISDKDYLESKRAPGWGKRSLSNLLGDEDWTDDVNQDFSKRAPGWGKRSLESYMTDKRAPGWGKRAPGWGKRAPGWGKRAPGWGKRAPGWGKRAPGWGKRSGDECASLEKEFNFYITNAVQMQVKLLTQCFHTEENERPSL